jgi:hypothetical protein
MPQQLEITFLAAPQEAAALLEFLSSVLRDHIKRALDTPEEVKAFDAASAKLRLALRKVIEPDGAGV